MGRRKRTTVRPVDEAMDDVSFMLEGMAIEVVPSPFESGGDAANVGKKDGLGGEMPIAAPQLAKRRRAVRKRNEPSVAIVVVQLVLVLIGMGTVASWIWRLFQWLWYGWR